MIIVWWFLNLKLKLTSNITNTINVLIIIEKQYVVGKYTNILETNINIVISTIR